MRINIKSLAPVGFVVVALAGWWAAATGAETPRQLAPRVSDRPVTIAVRALLEQEHLSRRAVDDEISQRAFKMYLESFDNRKMYFQQSDISEFRQLETKLDDEFNKGSIKFAFDVFNRFLQRLDERVKLVDELLQQPHDFQADETIAVEPEALTYPANDAEIRESWRKFIKLSLLSFKADGKDLDEARKKISQRYHNLQRRYHQSDEDEILERYLTAVTMSFDPHTSFMAPSNFENFQIQMRLNLEGIGAALMTNEDGTTTVSKVIPGGSAAQDGRLKKDDRIVSVGQGEDGPMVPVANVKLNDVVALIRGPAGSIVRLGVEADDRPGTEIIRIVRAKVELNDQAARSRVIEQGSQRIGVIELPSFYLDMEAAREDGRTQYRSTTRDVRKILDQFRQDHVTAVVLDLRENGGGSLTEAINLTGLFIDEGPVVQVKDSINRVQAYPDVEAGMAWSGPLVVVISKFSASASEILAGAIQDYRRGLVVGDESTHGKGTVQSLIDLGSRMFRTPNPPALGALKITMQQFYRPNGDSTQKRGVLSDVVLPSLSNFAGVGEGELDYAVEFDNVPRAQFAGYELVTPELVASVRQRSADRVSASAEFAKQRQEIERFRQFKDEKIVPLQETKFLARRAAEKVAEEEEEKKMDEQADPNRTVFPDEFYNREVVQITRDYADELARRNLAQAR